MKKAIFLFTLFVAQFAGANSVNSFSGSLSEFVLVQPCQDGDCNIYRKTISEVILTESQTTSNGRSLVMTLNAASKTKWQQGATILDVAAVRLTVVLPANIPSFGASAQGKISVILNDGEGRGVSTREYSAGCSISGNQKQLSCTSEGFNSPSHFLAVSLSR